MKKYWLFAQKTWDETLTFRFNFVLWRFRNVLQIFTFYYLWLAILPQNTSIAGYDRTLMLTYVLASSIVGSIVFSQRSYAIGEEINSGNLSNFLIKPLNYFFYWFTRDLGDKAMNMAFALVEFSLIFLILKPPFFIQSDITYLYLFAVSTTLALVSHFILSSLIEMIGFWSPEVWAPRFIFITLVTFFAGGLFPLDLMPEALYSFFQFLPFPYLLYFPVKIYLGQLSLGQIFFGFTIIATWSLAILIFLRFAWRKGLKIYTSYGK